MKTQIINEVTKYGPQTYEIGSCKMVKTSATIDAAVKTGKVKIAQSKRNAAGTGYEWVTLEKA